MIKYNTFYLCDGKQPCSKHLCCHKNGGQCKRTQKVAHAKHKDGERFFEVFEQLSNEKLLWEREE